MDSMNYEQLQGIRWILQPQTARTVWEFERIYRRESYKMPQACRTFFHRSDIEVSVDRRWHLERGSVLFFCNHDTAVDGFALPLACPNTMNVKRVIFAISALFLGREFCKRNLLVYPKGSYCNLIRNNSGFWDRLVYFATHRWGPFATRHTAVRAMCNALRSGSSISILPSGVIAAKDWRSGIGSVLLECAARNIRDEPIYAAPVYLDFGSDHHHLTVHAPGLIRFDTLLRQAGALTTRDEVTKWLQRRYNARSWVYDLCDVEAGS